MTKKKNTVELTFLALMRATKWWTAQDVSNAYKFRYAADETVCTTSRKMRRMAEKKLIEGQYFPNKKGNGRHKKWCLNHKNIRKLTC